MGKFLSMAALVTCQAASIFMNGGYGLATGVIFMVVYIAYDVATFRLIDHAQNPQLEESYRVWSGSLAVVTILFAVWTATAMMAIASYKKTVSDNSTSITTQESIRDGALSSAKQAQIASGAKPHLEAMYLGKASDFYDDAKKAQTKIDKLQAETPSDRNAIYSVIGALLGSRTAKIIEGLMILIGGALIPVLASSLFMFERRLSYKAKPKVQDSSKSMKPKAKAESRSRTAKKTTKKDATNIKDHSKYSTIQDAIFKQDISKPTKDELTKYGIGGNTAGAMLKEFEKQGLVKMGNRGYEYTDNMRAV